jgi:hypothetical protein
MNWVASKLGALRTPGQVQEEPAYCLGGVRHKGGVTLIQAFVRNVGTCVSMLREKLKWRSHESESTDAGHRGGVACSSEEGP